MGRWMLEARFALRRLRRRPTYTVLAVLTLALGVGGTAAIASIVRELLVNPLPYRADRELAMFWKPFDWNGRELLALRPEWSGFRSVAGYTVQDITLEATDAPTRSVPAVAATSELFDVLGVRPMIGRGFAAGEDAPGAEPVVVLSHDLWNEMGADPALVGKSVRMDGATRTVVGVMPRGFWFPDPATKAWIPVTITEASRSGMYALVGRVGPGRDVAHMQPEVARVTRFLGEHFTYPPQWDLTKDASLTPLREALVGGMRPALMATLAAMAVILLIACANVATLMLGQVESRSSELAVRSALGADRARLTTQLVFEAMVLGLLSGAAGTVVAIGAFRVLRGTLPLGAWGEHAALDWGLFGGAMLFALLASLLVAVLPAVAVARSDLRAALSASRTGGVASRRGGLQGMLVVGEVALAVLLAAGAGLLVHSVQKLYEVRPGIATRGVAVIDVAMPATMPLAERRALIAQLPRELSALPGVRVAALSHKLPLRGNGSSTSIRVPGVTNVERPPTTYFRLVSPGYFAALGIPTLAGRVFDGSERPSDSTTTEVPVVINQSLAQTYFPDRDPIGQVLPSGFGGTERIIGIVGDVAEGELTDPPAPARYYVETQMPFMPLGQSFVIRTAREGDADAILGAAQRTIVRVAPSLAVLRATTMERVLAVAVGPARQVMQLLAMLTGLALVLGAIGIYGVIAHFVTRRTRDWSIRVALGLAPWRVIRLVLAHGAALVLAGVAIGVVGTIVLARLMSSLLYGVTTADPWALASASALLVVAGLLAALIPAVRASRVDPALVLRER